MKVINKKYINKLFSIKNVFIIFDLICVFYFLQSYNQTNYSNNKMIH